MVRDHHSSQLPHYFGCGRAPRVSRLQSTPHSNDEKRTALTAIISQRSSFGVVLAVPMLHWIIVNHSRHWAFGALGVVALSLGDRLVNHE